MFFFTFYEEYRVQNRGRIPRRTFGTTPNTISCVFGPGHGGTRAYPPWVCRQAFAGLKKASSNEKGLHPVEMTSWFHWLTFDVVGDLAFGESCGCPENSTYYAWVSLTFDVMK